MLGAPIGAEVGLRLKINRECRPIEPGDLIESVSGLIYLVESVRAGSKWFTMRVVKLDPASFDGPVDWVMV